MNVTEIQALPPLAAIRAFEAAARHGSFTHAAGELGMTQAAVSYQIRVLEDRVGVPLFRRRARGVSLTADGARLAERAGEALEILRQAFAEARRSSDETLVISVLTTFATHVLASRLGRFQIDHPEVTTRLDVDNRLSDLQAGEASVAIRYGLGKWPGLQADLLIRTTFTPMIGRAFAERHGVPERPEDLQRLPLIDPDDNGWAKWFEAVGLAAPRPTGAGRLMLGTELLSSQAVLAGQGAGLLTPFYFRELLARGDLIQPFDVALEDSGSIWLCYPERRRNVPAIRAFRDWLLAEVRAMVPPGARLASAQPRDGGASG